MVLGFTLLVAFCESLYFQLLPQLSSMHLSHLLFFVFFFLACAKYEPSTKVLKSNAELIPIQLYYKSDSLKNEGKQLMRSFFITSDSLMEGSYKEFYKSGQVMREENYTNGIKDGTQKTYYPNGLLESEHYYKNGHLQGNYKWYHKNGKIRQEGIKENGRTIGQIKSYFDSGTIKSIANYHQGIKRGEAKEYNESGQLLVESFYNSRGKLVFQIPYHPNGTIDVVLGDPILELEAIKDEFKMNIKTEIAIGIPKEFIGQLKVEKHFKQRKIKQVKIDRELRASETIVLTDEFNKRENGLYSYYISVSLTNPSTGFRKQYYDSFTVEKNNSLEITYVE